MPPRTLSELVRARDALDAEITATVADLRAAGFTWHQLGAEMGMTRQGARQRYGRPDRTKP